MVGIYKITNPEGKVYIGQSKDIDKRFYSHKFRSVNAELRKSIDKYGADKHLFEVIEECSSDELLVREKFFIDKYKDLCFNLEPGRPRGIETTTIRIPRFLKQELSNWLNKKKRMRINLKPIIARWIDKKLKKHVEHVLCKNNS